MDLSQDKYKLSRYNVFQDDGDVRYMWNTYSDALLELDKSGRDYIENFSGLNDESAEFKLLKDNGFIVCERLNEFGRVCIQEKQYLFASNPESLSFVIAPGMGCNYKCSYCFEKNSDKTGVMTSETAVEVAEYICNRLKNNPNAKRLNISWFGGEPLLYIDIIKILSHRLIEYTKQNNVEYYAKITTNGRYLDENVLEMFNETRIKNAQITIDGLCDLYCKSKGASPEDYKAVVDNICRACEKIKISIRMNIPYNNADEAISVTDYFLSELGLQNKVRVHLAQVYDFSQSQSASKKSFGDFIQNYFVWINHLISRYGMSEVRSLFPKHRAASCGSMRVASACIGPLGELYKCEHSFGDKSMEIGNVRQGRFFNEAELAYYQTATNGACSECGYLPVCMGGCQNYRLIGFASFDCETFKKERFRMKLLEGGKKYEIAR